MRDNGGQVDVFDATRYSVVQRFHTKFQFREISVSHPFVSIGAVLALSAAAPAFAAAPAPVTPKMTLAQAPAAAKPAPRPATRADLINSADANFKKVDTNNDGVLNKAEIDAAQVRMQQQASANIGTRIQAEFNKLDTDKNGQLSLAEFKAAAPAPKAPGAASATAMAKLDTQQGRQDQRRRISRADADRVQCRRHQQGRHDQRPGAPGRSGQAQRVSQELSLRISNNDGRRSDAPPVSYGLARGAARA